MSIDNDGTLKPAIVRRLKESLATPKDKLLTSEQMGKKLGLTPVESLTRAIGPGGDLEPRKPCDCLCHTLKVGQVVSGIPCHNFGECVICHGTGTILDTENPLFQALWEKCPHPSLYVSPNTGRGAFCKDCDTEWPKATKATQNLVGYVLRSRAEVALSLPDAALSLLADDGYIVIAREGISLVGFPGKPQQEDRIWSSGHWLAALCAAVEAAIRAQEVKP